MQQVQFKRELNRRKVINLLLVINLSFSPESLLCHNKILRLLRHYLNSLETHRNAYR